MANICNNSFYLTKQGSEEDYKKSSENLIDFLNSINADYYAETDFIDGYFDSKWVFPIEELQDLLVGDVYFRCLSEEYGCGYVAMNIYDNGWKSEQTFDL